MASLLPEYKCGQCGIQGVKLWREYQTFLDRQSLLCAACAIKEQTNDRKSYEIDQDDVGSVTVTTHYNPTTEPNLYRIFGGSDRGGDQIGWRIPAVPTEEGTTYWGYSAVPEKRVAWWNKLPLRHGGPR